MSAKSTVLGNSFLYTFSSLLVKSINFILLPLYTLLLTPEDYGIVNLVNNFIQVATFIIAFSLYSSVVRFYADYKNDLEKIKRFYGTVIIFVFSSGVIFTCIGLVLKDLLINLIFEGISFYPFVFIALVTMTFVALHSIHQSILQSRQQGKKLTLINLIVFGLQVCLTLYFIVFLELGAVGMLFATMLINISYFIYMLIDLKKDEVIAFSLDIEILKEALKYSIPIMPHNLSTHIASFSSRILINNNGTLATVGLYSVASQFSTLIDTVQTSVNKAFTPWFNDGMNKGGSNKDIVKLSQLLLILYSFIYIGIGLFSQEVILLFTPENYHLAWTVIPLLVVGFSVKSIYYFYINILFYYKDAARRIFIATLSGSIVDIILAFILVPKYGMYGSAIAFMIAKIIVVGIVIFISKNYKDIGYRVTGMIKIILPSILFMSLGLSLSYTKYLTIISVLNIFYKIGILFAYILFTYFMHRELLGEFVTFRNVQKLLIRRKKLL